MSTDIRDITATDWQPRLDAPGEIVTGAEDVAQCLRILFATQKRSDPHRPDFGCDLLKWIDKPASQAAPGLIREALEAAKRWEPRADIVAMNADIDTAAPHHVTLRYTFRVLGTAATLSAETVLA